MTAAGGELAISVTLVDPKFKLATFPAGSTPPAWARALITNPKAWASAPEESAPPPEDPPAPPDGEGEGTPPDGEGEGTPPEGEGTPPEGESSSLPDETADKAQGDGEDVSAPETEPQGSEDLIGELPEPPKNGAGSGRDAWVAYANSKKVVFAENASRADIIAAVEAAAE